MAETPAEKDLADFWHGHGRYNKCGTHDAAKATRLLLEQHIVIPRSEPVDGEIIEEAMPNGITVKAGSGPESVYEFIHVNPNWLRNKAVNLLNVADYIENRDAIVAAKEAEASAARDKRRDELAGQFAGIPRGNYANCTELSQKAIDYIIELEDAAK